MNKLQHIIAFFVAFTALFACSPEQDELFDDSAAERSAKDISRVRDILCSPANGWRMEYYGDLTYGGYNVLLKFTGDSVTIASEKAGVAHNAGLDANGRCITATSHYKLEQSMGTVLSVDEYNDVFHYFSTPNNPDYGTKDEGFLGDFEFRIIKASPDSLVLRGKKHSDRIYMFPVESGKTWEDVLNDAAATELFMDSRNYTLGGVDYNDNVGAYAYYHTLIFQYRDSLGDLQSVQAPFISTEKGYKFYAPVEVKGITIEGVDKGDNQDRYLLSNNSNMWLNSYLPTLTEHLMTSYWFIAYSNLGEFAQPYWDTFKTKIKKAKKGNQEPVVYWAVFGSYGGKDGISLNIDGELAYQGCTYTSNEDETEITLRWASGLHNGKGDKFYKQYGLREALIPFFGSYGRTFVVDTDNQRHPTYLRLTDKDEPTNVIILTADAVNMPFDN